MMKRAFVVVAGLVWALAAAACGDDAATPTPPGSTGSAPICQADAECDGQVCDAFRGCVECRSASQCAAGERCLGGKCAEAQACAEDEQCNDEAPHCDTGSQTCVECGAAEHCPAGSACADGACQPASFCDDVSGCRLGTVCDLENGRCVECLGTKDCGDGEHCVDQRCTATCAEGSECPAGLVCDPLLHVCAECVSTKDCPESEHCSGSVCVLDVCVAGTGTCDASLLGIRLCNDAGERVQPLYCSKHAKCVGDPGEAECSDWVCKAGITACNADGQHLETCSADGLTVEASVDCSETNQACVGNACVDIICDPGKTTCSAADNALHACSANGTVDTVTPCSASQYCDEGTLACAEKVCFPESVVCVGEQVGTCNALGSDYESLEDCESNQTCVAGACQDIICDPNDQLCGEDGNAYTCNTTGTVLMLKATCEAPGENGEGGGTGDDYGQHCQDQGAQAGCFYDPCVEGQPYCDQNTLKTCNALGTGPVDEGTDCGADAVCVSGNVPACAPKICTPSQKYCDAASGDVYYCSADGTSSYVWDYCDVGEYCNTDSAACNTMVCTPNAAGCNGTVASTCNAEGSAWLVGGQDCALTSTICDAGACKAKICEPYNYFCRSGDVHYCGQLGTTSTEYDACEAAEYCSPGYYYCLPDQCTAGQPVCVSQTHRATCKSDGSGPNGAGTACGADKSCDQGACKDQVCTPSSRFCDGGHVQQCSSNGLTFSQATYCFADEYCKEAGTNATCEKRICTTGDDGCTGESFGQCNVDGSGYTDSATACTAVQVCSMTGCATQAVDTLGGILGGQDPHTTVWEDLIGDYIQVDTARELVKIELNVTGMTDQTLHWGVYEAATFNGTYALIFDSFTDCTPGAGFQSSGDISVDLEAGKFYLIAAYGSYIWGPYNSTNTLGPNLSFGRVRGSVFRSQSGLAATLPGPTQVIDEIYNFRLTTQAP